jgi:hypothetical protein
VVLLISYSAFFLFLSQFTQAHQHHQQRFLLVMLAVFIGTLPLIFIWPWFVLLNPAALTISYRMRHPLKQTPDV